MKLYQTTKRKEKKNNEKNSPNPYVFPSVAEVKILQRLELGSFTGNKS